MKTNHKKRYSKRELLEIMLAQQTEIEKLEAEVTSLKQEVETKSRQMNEIVNLVQVTNKLVQITNIMERRVKPNTVKEKH